ncbi:Uncharacterised protein [Mycobacteroides abscessus subsp. abscessus]|nr:Uncharacterised protein [Mycobacteroides abscessus subsp. abscessus]
MSYLKGHAHSGKLTERIKASLKLGMDDSQGLRENRTGFMVVRNDQVHAQLFGK